MKMYSSIYPMIGIGYKGKRLQFQNCQYKTGNHTEMSEKEEIEAIESNPEFINKRIWECKHGEPPPPVSIPEKLGVSTTANVGEDSPIKSVTENNPSYVELQLSKRKVGRPPKKKE